VLLHQPLIAGVLEGPATELEIEAKEILRLRSRLYNILARHTGQSPEKIEKDCDRNLWLEAEEAISYGLVDRILQKAPEIVRDTEQSS
jgi:ATP-dependent Clp protease protease subunit